MNVLIIPNFNKSGSVLSTRLTVQKLLELGFSPMLEPVSATKAGVEDVKGCIVSDFESMLQMCDIILTIGGDGTILHAVKHSLRVRKPLLGINTGRIGFLTQLEENEHDKLVALRDGNYKILHRMLIEATLVQDGVEQSFFALNEAVLSRGDSHRLVEIAVTREGRQVALHRADGVIFSTPTGSSAYNLSAGGPLADPTLSLILMTALCPHSHFHHTIILSPEHTYRVKEVPGSNESGLVLQVDGQNMGVLREGGQLLIRAANVQAPFIDLGLSDFFRRVELKLRVDH